MIYDYHSVIGGVAVLIGVGAYGLYFRTIFRGDTKPHLFTWLIFALIDGTVFVAQVLEGAGPGSWVLLLSVVENLVVVALALKWGEKHIAKSDWTSFIAALAGIMLWRLMNDPLIAVVIAVGINIAAAYPTFRKSYARPDEESITVWAIDGARFTLGMVALVTFNLTTALFPAAIVLTNTSLVGMILYRRRQLAKR